MLSCVPVPQWSRGTAGTSSTGPDWLLSVVVFERLFSPVEALITNVSSFVYKSFLDILDDVLLLRQTQVATPHTRLVHTTLFQKFPCDAWCGI